MRRSIIRTIRSARTHAARARREIGLSHRALMASLDKLEEGEDPIVAGVLLELALLYKRIRRPLCYAFIDEATRVLLDDLQGQERWTTKPNSSRGASRSKP